ncbi:sortase [Helicobacter pylori]|uniref:sortase n=1 Tax=Helicobacter pylori TaxID=210 RepID=UPI000FDDAA90|nr:sortase [Helicobacter pylori]RVZ93947.1 sortase [Helicobacter pylori]WQW97191.1 sortase [Helicobacter pylori]
MPLPFILAGYGVKKIFDASDTADEINIVIKKANDLKEEAKRKVDNAQSSRNQALVRLGKKKLHVLSYTVSNFLDHFHRLERSRIIIKGINMQDIQKQVLDARNLLNQLNANNIDKNSTLGVIAGCGSLGASIFTIGASMVGGLLAASALAIFWAISADEMEKKRDDAKAYYSQIEAAVKEADVVIDNLQAVRKMADLFTRQITKFDALFFSLSIDAITTMKKHHYDTSRYNQKEKDQLCVTVSTLMTLSAFLKVPIMDEHQKLNEKTQKALNLMRDQMDSLENGHYSLRDISFRQAQLEDLRDDKTS